MASHSWISCVTVTQENQDLILGWPITLGEVPAVALGHKGCPRALSALCIDVEGGVHGRCGGKKGLLGKRGSDAQPKAMLNLN